MRRALPVVALNPVERTGTGQVFLWLERATVNRLERLRLRDGDLSDVIIRLAARSSGTPP
jgi:hypothetical protein